MKEQVIAFCKKYFPWIVAFVIVLVVAIVGILFLMKGMSQENTLKTYLKEMGTEFYENLYYQQVGSDLEKRTEFLSKFKDIGVKVSLDSLSRYNAEQNKEKLDAFVNKKTNEECDRNESKIIIYPQEPYGQTDYRYEIQLVCGFD